MSASAVGAEVRAFDLDDHAQKTVKQVQQRLQQKDCMLGEVLEMIVGIKGMQGVISSPVEGVKGKTDLYFTDAVYSVSTIPSGLTALRLNTQDAAKILREIRNLGVEPQMINVTSYYFKLPV